jgi:hypothetical protein
MKKNHLLILSCFLLLHLTSCVSNKQLSQYNSLLIKQTEIEHQVIELSKNISEKAEDEVRRGELSPTNAEKIIRKITDETTKMQERKSTNRSLSEELLQTKTGVRKKTVKKVSTLLTESNSEVLAYAEKLNLLQDAFAVDNLKTYKTAAFFPPGEYKIHEKYQSKVTTTFSKVFDEVINFSAVHNGVQSTAIINTVGYADEQDFNPSSGFVSSAKEKLALNKPSRQALNQLLSTYRAEALAQSLQSVLNFKISTLQDQQIDDVQINAEGKGEEYPNPRINDYQKIDERRRIVVVYWNVLPTEFLSE